MIEFLKGIWRKLPSNARLRIRFYAKTMTSMTSSLFGRQNLTSPVGRVKVPHFTKSKLRMSFAQQGEDLILDRIIHRVLGWDLNEKRLYVDVGPYDAIDHSVTYLLYLRGWSGIVFDPSLETKKSFERARPKDIFINALVGDDDEKEVAFYVPKTEQRDKSIFNTKYPPNARKDEFKLFKQRQVNLTNELTRRGINKIDFLSLDVEGSEYEILQSLNFELFKPSIVAIEIKGFDICGCLESKEAILLRENGYKLVGSAVITHFFVRSAEINR